MNEPCAVCGCPAHAHAGKTKQDDAYASPVCVRCFNAGRKAQAWHVFAPAQEQAA